MAKHKFTAADVSDVQHALKYLTDIRERVETDAETLDEIDTAIGFVEDLQDRIKKDTKS